MDIKYSTMTLATFNDLNAKVAKMWEQVHALRGTAAATRTETPEDRTAALAAGLQSKIGKADLEKGNKVCDSAGRRFRELLRKSKQAGDKATGDAGR